MSTPFDPKYYDKENFHQGTIPAETMISVHCSEVILKLLEKIDPKSRDEIFLVLKDLTSKCKQYSDEIQQLKEEVFKLQNGGRSPTDYERFKYNQVKTTSSSQQASKDYSKEYYFHHYGVDYNPLCPQ